MKKGEILFKILLCTNYPIYYKTEDSRDESMDSRIVVLPFEKDLKSATIDNSEIRRLVDYIHSEKFKEEKVHIAIRSLCYFRGVLNNNCEFICRYPINSCVVGLKVNMNDNKNDDTVIGVTDYTIKNTSKNISDKNFALIELLKNNFEYTEEEKDYMTAEQLWNYICEFMPETNGRTHDVGKVVKSVFGDKANCRRNGKTWYKIKLKKNYQ